MKLPQWTNPLLSMLASLAMCVILNVSHETNASSKHRVISINHDDGQRSYHVDGKRFSFDELSREDRNKVLKIESKLAALEESLEENTVHIEKYHEQIEKVAETIERHAERFEATIEGVRLSDIKQTSEDIENSGLTLKEKMRTLESKLRELENNMPEIERNVIEDIEVQAEILEELLVEIASRI